MRTVGNGSLIGVGLSGGTDSTCALLELREAGYAPVAYTMITGEDGDQQILNAAKAVAKKLDVKHKIVDVKSCFDDKVLQYFRTTYASGKTPSPCVACNRFVKFGALMESILADGCEFMATGHYARLQRTDSGMSLLRALDSRKDQSYFLSQVDRASFNRVLFPLGELLKTDVAQRVKELGIVPKAEKESQDLCFLPDGRYDLYLEKFYPDLSKEGWIVDSFGKQLGRHMGAFRYTPGQRRGLGLGGGPWFVIRTDIVKNQVVVGHQDELSISTINLSGLNWLTTPVQTLSCRVQIRYLMKPRAATLFANESGCGQLVFDDPIESAPPGQLAVGYDDQQVLFSAWIEN